MSASVVYLCWLWFSVGYSSLPSITLVLTSSRCSGNTEAAVQAEHAAALVSLRENAVHTAAEAEARFRAEISGLEAVHTSKLQQLEAELSGVRKERLDLTEGNRSLPS